MRTTIVGAVVAVALVAAACNRSAEPELSVTTSSLVTTSTEGSGVTATTTASEPSSSTTSLVGQQVESFEVVVREPGEHGDILYVVIPPGSYTDLDLEDFVNDMIEANPGLEELHVFDDPDAVIALRTPEEERTAEQVSMLESHHLLSLFEGKVVRFQGPFAEMGEFVLGS